MLARVGSRAAAQAAPVARRSFSLFGGGAGQEALTEEHAGTPHSSPSAPQVATGVEVTTLSNGVKVASRDTHALSSSVALYVNAGSRYEGKSNAGVAHFLSRMAFKSSQSRTHFRTVRDAESAGVSLSSTVGREALVLAAEGQRAGAADMVQFIAESATEPLLAPWEVSEWAAALGRDLDLLEANPDVVVGEAIHAAAFNDATPMGRSAYCRRDRLGAVSADSLRDHLSARFTGGNMVLAATNVSHGELVALAEKALGGVAAGGAAADPPLSPYSGGEARVAGASSLVHVALAFKGPGYGDANLASAAVLRALLGGESAGSRLGAGSDAADVAAAFAAPYSDVGLFGVYGSAAGAKGGALVDFLSSALTNAASSDASDAELSRARNVAKAAVLATAETRVGARDDIGLQILATGKHTPAADAIKAIESVSAADVKSFAASLFSHGASVAAVGDTSEVPRLRTLASRFA